MNKIKSLILFTVFIDIIGIGIVIPVLPFYIRSFGATDFVVTLLMAIFALLSFVSSPFLGALSDRFGRRPILIVSIASTALGWLVFASAKSVLWLFIGRGIDGLAAGNITTAQSYLSDISKDEKERTSNMGLIGVMFGIGLVVGPLLGGMLGAISHTLPFWFVGFLSLLNTIMAYLWLPETHHDRIAHGKIEMNPLAPIIRGLKNKKLFSMLLAWFLFGFAVSIQYSILSLFLNKVYGLEEFGSGLVLTLVGVVLAFNQGFLIRTFWLKKFEHWHLTEGGLLAVAIGLFLMSVPLGIIFFIGIIGMTFGQSIIRTVMTSQVAGYDPARRGENLGTLNAFMSLSMVVGPVVAGALYMQNSFLPFIFAGMSAFIGYYIVIVSRKKLETQ